MMHLRTTKIGFSILGMAFLVVSFQSAAVPEDKTGFALLENLAKEIISAVKNETSPSVFEDRLNVLIADAKKARSLEQIDHYFFRKYTSLLAFIKLGTTTNDPEGILWPLMERVAGDYIRSVTGDEPPGSLKVNYAEHGAVSFGNMSNAVVTEITSLHLYLETKDRRPAVMKFYLQIVK